jgi:hypothetical protein
MPIIASTTLSANSSLQRIEWGRVHEPRPPSPRYRVRRCERAWPYTHLSSVRTRTYPGNNQSADRSKHPHSGSPRLPRVSASRIRCGPRPDLSRAACGNSQFDSDRALVLQRRPRPSRKRAAQNLLAPLPLCVILPAGVGTTWAGCRRLADVVSATDPKRMTCCPRGIEASGVTASSGRRVGFS